MKPLCLTIFFALASSTLLAQVSPSKEPLPEGPLLARAPAFSRWIVTIKPVVPPTKSGTAGGKDGELKSLVTKTKDIYYQEFADVFGRKWKTWVADRLQATISPDNGSIILGDGGDGLLATDYSKTDFQGMEWISAENFVKTASYEGRKCLLFSVSLTTIIRAVPAIPGETAADGTPIAPAVAPAPTKNTEVATGVIDFDSRLPLYAQKGGVSYTFKFDSPPTSMLQIPEEILKVVRQQSQRAKDMAAPVPRAY